MSTSNLLDPISHPQTMRLYFVLAVVAALTASISASDAAGEVASAKCPWFCARDSTCSSCEGGFCSFFVCF
ncbi:hypothetical protein F4604DRAFT_1751204 [Suillus subluteus]|nr:hypothetical protein F4604DRAFT_1789604 [Suillus subluteus]KAG1879721.1 hypothetical protein F4604DRAFT_1751204 [Suillus subluteus]